MSAERRRERLRFFRHYFSDGCFEGAFLEDDEPVDLVEFVSACGKALLHGAHRAEPAFLHDVDEVLDLSVDLTLLGEEITQLGTLPILMTSVASDQCIWQGDRMFPAVVEIRR
jgi:hypothetical protein